MAYDTLIFDIDHTLYHPSKEIEVWFLDRVGEYIAQTLDLPRDEALALAHTYYELFGSTLSGLLYFHEITLADFLKSKGYAPLDAIHQDKSVLDRLKRDPRRKIAFTNATHRHGAHILAHLGVADAFEQIYGVDDLGFWGKPFAQSYLRVFERTGIDPKSSIFFDDTLRNLKYPSKLGVHTVLVSPVAQEKPLFVNYMAQNLEEALDYAARI